jgi:hypothetical protein
MDNNLNVRGKFKHLVLKNIAVGLFTGKNKFTFFSMSIFNTKFLDSVFFGFNSDLHKC